jgi:L-asparaginase/Glu-tRNA(Gln) amidotransferase subunit D
MRRRDFTIGLLLAAAVQSARAQERAKQHRIAIVIAGGTIARISETSCPNSLARLSAATRT